MLFYFDFKINANPYQSDNYMPLLVCHYKITKYLHIRLISLSALCLYVFFWSLTLALLTKHTTFSRESVDVFSIAAQVFSNSFLKICPLFGQILITCLKCFMASFSLSSYSKKMHWGRGWNLTNGWRKSCFKACFLSKHFWLRFLRKL